MRMPERRPGFDRRIHDVQRCGREARAAGALATRLRARPAAAPYQSGRTRRQARLEASYIFVHR